MISIEKDNWYGWQMLPGYAGELCIPYFSPVFVKDFKALKTGNGLFRIDFLNVAYAEGMQDFSMEIRVLKRAKDYLVGDIVEGKSVNPARCAIISNIEWGWLQRFCPELLVRHPLLSSSDPSSESLNRYLNEVFLQSHG